MEISMYAPFNIGESHAAISGIFIFLKFSWEPGISDTGDFKKRSAPNVIFADGFAA